MQSKVAPPTVYCADGENGGKDPAGKDVGISKMAVQVMESTLFSATKKKFEIRYEEGYGVKDDELRI